MLAHTLAVRNAASELIRATNRDHIQEEVFDLQDIHLIGTGKSFRIKAWAYVGQ